MTQSIADAAAAGLRRRRASVPRRRDGQKGVDLRLTPSGPSIERAPAGLVSASRAVGSVEVDAALFATGRVPNVTGLGLEAAGVAGGDGGKVLVDQHYPDQRAIDPCRGDAHCAGATTPVALGEAMVVVDRLFGTPSDRIPLHGIRDFTPSAVFTIPGRHDRHDEERRRAEFGVIGIYRKLVKALRHTLNGNGERTMMKLVVDQATDHVVGLHMVGATRRDRAGLRRRPQAGATKAVFDATIGIHPTTVEEFVTMREPVAPWRPHSLQVMMVPRSGGGRRPSPQIKADELHRSCKRSPPDSTCARP